MNRIEVGLHEHHARLAQQAAQNPETSASQAAPAASTGPTTLEAPFAKVNSVVPDSPAETAGLKVGDTITKFAWVDWTNHDKLSKVAEVVSQNEGVSCPLSKNLPRRPPIYLVRSTVDKRILENTTNTVPQTSEIHRR